MARYFLQWLPSVAPPPAWNFIPLFQHVLFSYDVSPPHSYVTVYSLQHQSLQDLFLSDGTDIYICPLSMEEEWSWPRLHRRCHTFRLEGEASQHQFPRSLPRRRWQSEWEGPAVNSSAVFNRNVWRRRWLQRPLQEGTRTAGIQLSHSQPMIFSSMLLAACC